MFEEYWRLIKILRKKCPWDRKQTVASSRQYILNEAYEFVDALTKKNLKAITEELGDLIFTTLFVANILVEKKKLKLKEVEKLTVKKIIARHPHVFGKRKVKNVKEVLSNWEAIKKEEAKTPMLARLPKTLPALMRAQLIQERVGRVGFDWSDKQEVFLKIEEEIYELKEALNKKTRKKIKEELGDLYFALVNLTRHLGLNAEEVLSLANEKFVKRFNKLEAYFKSRHKKLSDVSLSEMDRIWEKLKTKKQ
jgi:MazG family protein